MNTLDALIIVDMQNDFMETGSLPVPQSSLIISNIVEKINSYVKNGKQVIATMDWHPSNHFSFKELWPKHCVKNTFGAKLIKEIPLELIDKVIYKGTDLKIDSYSAFFDNDHKSKTDLAEYLVQTNIDTLEIVGLAGDFCVYFTVVDALNLGYNVRIDLNCIKAIDQTKMMQQFNELKQKGLVIISEHTKSN